jgi:hypothetical protein
MIALEGECISFVFGFDWDVMGGLGIWRHER